LHDFSHKKNFLHDYNKIKIKEAVQCGIYRRLFLIGDPNIRKKCKKNHEVDQDIETFLVAIGGWEEGSKPELIVCF
jgi:hypothetical protein